MGGAIVQSPGCLPGVYEALGSVSDVREAHASSASTWSVKAGGSGVQKTQLHCGFDASLRCTRGYLKQIKENRTKARESPRLISTPWELGFVTL